MRADTPIPRERQIIRAAITREDRAFLVGHVRTYVASSTARNRARASVYRLLGIPTARDGDRNATREIVMRSRTCSKPI